MKGLGGSPAIGTFTPKVRMKVFKLAFAPASAASITPGPPPETMSNPRPARYLQSSKTDWYRLSPGTARFVPQTQTRKRRGRGSKLSIKLMTSHNLKRAHSLTGIVRPRNGRGTRQVVGSH